MIKLKDLFNKKINKANNQESLDLKKRVFKKYNINIDDILNIKLNKKVKVIEEW